MLGKPEALQQLLGRAACPICLISLSHHAGRPAAVCFVSEAALFLGVYCLSVHPHAVRKEAIGSLADDALTAGDTALVFHLLCQDLSVRQRASSFSATRFRCAQDCDALLLGAVQ